MKIAEDFGAVGVILYSDPDDVARDGVGKGGTINVTHKYGGGRAFLKFTENSLD